MAAVQGYARKTVPDGKNGEYEIVEVSDDFKWRFQKFKTYDYPSKTKLLEISPLLGSGDVKGSIRYDLARTPSDIAKSKKLREIYQLNLGTDTVAHERHIVYADLKSMLEDLVSGGFEVASESLQTEVFLGDDQ
jgi:hypothetical protein